MCNERMKLCKYLHKFSTSPPVLKAVLGVYNIPKYDCNFNNSCVWVFFFLSFGCSKPNSENTSKCKSLDFNWLHNNKQNTKQTYTHLLFLAENIRHRYASHHDSDNSSYLSCTCSVRLF